MTGGAGCSPELRWQQARLQASEAMADFLLLRVFLAGAAVVSVLAAAAAAAGPAAGAALESAEVFLLLRVFLVPVVRL